MLQKSLAAAVMMAAALPAWAGKDDIAKSVAGLADESWEMAKSIWEYAEPGYLETRSSKLIADRLEKAGFKVSRGVAGIPTAFTATFGEGKPLVAILGEYDALP
ncbi:MAG: amidohydrolase, partial [Planctomycetota bacterium]